MTTHFGVDAFANELIYWEMAIVVAVIMRFSLDPDVGGPITWFLASPVLYPSAALSYTGYLWSRATPFYAARLLHLLGYDPWFPDTMKARCL